MTNTASRSVRSTPRRKNSGPAAPRGLLYVSDRTPGIRRHRRGAGFSYQRPDGQPLRSPLHIERIKRLAVPPAYTGVWICPRADGHLQATGTDARGRKQYRYHAQWRSARDGDKFGRMLEFGLALPRIRDRVASDLRSAGEPHVRRHTLLATMVRLLDTTLIRVGNEEYTRTNGSFGLTTLRNRHARIDGDRVHLRFRGKSGVARRVWMEDPRVARIVRACQAMPGQELFQYEGDNGRLQRLGSADVNRYLREASGADFTAKDFRTWHASVHALALLSGTPAASGPLAKRQVHEVLVEVSQRLGNTVAVCRASYVHPLLLQLAANGRLQQRINGASGMRRSRLRADEARLLLFLGAIRHHGRAGLSTRSSRPRRDTAGRG